jgi:hypothetical protein
MKALISRLQTVRRYLEEDEDRISCERALCALKECLAIAEAVGDPVPPRGCICPVGAEKTCANYLCPRSILSP